MKNKSKGNEFVKMAVDTAMFGVGASMIGNASQQFNGNPTAKSVVDATGTVYAAKFLERTMGRGKKGLL